MTKNRKPHLGKNPISRVGPQLVSSLRAHWIIKSVSYKPSEESVVLSVPEIVELASKMSNEDVIYTYHVEHRPYYRIALEGTDSDEVIVSIQGSAGAFDKKLPICEIHSILKSFEDVLLKFEEYGFKPDWE